MKLVEGNDCESVKANTTNLSSINLTNNEHNFQQSSNVNDEIKRRNNLQHVGISDSNNRRYSSAPVASKDEQAELIRKQKAKLERHFRRSTQVNNFHKIQKTFLIC